ncbi:DUF808 domain-containing protein [Pikeienuella sp. HZG-20]|uniref:DUF808 domain-containing protein n=1 Tax=Paludibacillus litoralis TaxID=3133267 RepID=UPI0030EDD554
MSGLLALLDDVAAIAKLAAAQLDDVAAQATKAGTKAASLIIDDTAVTPKYVVGLPAARELPIVWKIARGSVFNKIVILLPAALLLDAVLPWLLMPLLMIGGGYLCYEGAEKIWGLIHPHPEHGPQATQPLSAARLEETRVKGAIKTDFILSAEIMTIALTMIGPSSTPIKGAVLVVVAIGITALVYGSVALLVKADDVGLSLSLPRRPDAIRALGRFIVKAMPALMALISTVGTAAMLWVGGGIITHGLEVLGWPAPYEAIRHAAASAAAGFGGAHAGIAWVVTATGDGLFGLALGFCLIPVVAYAITPAIAAMSRKDPPKE